MYTHTYTHTYIIICIIQSIPRSLPGPASPRGHAKRSPRCETTCARAAANLRTKLLDFRGSDSSIILVLRGGFPSPIGKLLVSLSQAILVGIILVGRLDVPHRACLCCRQMSPARGGGADAAIKKRIMGFGSSTTMRTRCSGGKKTGVFLFYQLQGEDPTALKCGTYHPSTERHDGFPRGRYRGRGARTQVGSIAGWVHTPTGQRLRLRYQCAQWQ